MKPKLRQSVKNPSNASHNHQEITEPKILNENCAIAMSVIQQVPAANDPNHSSGRSSDKTSTSSPPVGLNSRRKLSNNRPSDYPQFIESLKAPRRLLNHITIEPLAFIAILALYIEFPSIQDLIYTKICLQVVANHPNLTTLNFHSTTISPSIILTNGTTPAPTPASNQLNETTSISNSTTNFHLHEASQAHFLCDRLNKTAIPKSVRQEIADGDSLFWLKYQLIICLLCALSCPYWGGMSDKIGRLIPLNVPIVVATISNLISLIFGLLISLNWHELIRVEWLYLGAVLTGLSGGQAVVIVNSFSFISDNTNSESRSRRVTVLEAVIYLSHSVGFLITRFIMKLGLESSLERPWLNRHIVAFSICVLLNLICILYSLCKLRHHNFHRFMNNFEREQYETFYGSTTLPTSGSTSRFDSTISVMDDTTGVANVDRPRELTASTPDDLDGPIARSDKRWTDWGTVLTFKYYKETYETATKRRETRTMIQLLLFCGFISAMSLAIMMSLLYIYLRMEPFNWNTSQYSLWNMLTSISRGFALVGLTICMKFITGFNVPDPILATIGFLSKGTGLLMIALAQSSTLINWALLAFVMSEFSLPPIRSLLSKLVVKEEVGKVYSCLAAIQSLCFLVGNIVFYVAYTSLNLQDFFRLSFLVVASFEFVAVIIMLIIYTTLRSRVVVV